jgi:hypothetical protein
VGAGVIVGGTGCVGDGVVVGGTGLGIGVGVTIASGDGTAAGELTLMVATAVLTMVAGVVEVLHLTMNINTTSITRECH